MVENIILIAVITAIITGAGLYIYKQKKKGAVCIGCPHAKECAKKNSTCSCNSHSDKQ